MTGPIDFAEPDAPGRNGAANGADGGQDEGGAYARAVGAAKGPPKAFTIWTPAEIWKPLEPPDYLFGGLLVRGSLSLIVAYGASLKTWVLLDAVLSVATGTSWMGRFPTKQGKALLIDFESGDYELRRRAHRLARGRELPIPIDAFSLVTMPPMSLADDSFYTAVTPLAKEYAFIGIDSLAAGSAGIDENDSRFATSLQRLKALSAETGCVTQLLHHNRKGKGDGDTDAREMVRGSSAIFNACDVVLQMARSSTGTGSDGGFAVHQTKARGGKAVEPFVVRVDDTAPDASIVVASNMPEPGDGETMGAAKAIDKAKRAVLLLLGQERDLKSASDIWRRVKGNRPTCLGAVKELEEHGLIHKHDGAFRLVSEVT